MLDTMSMEEKLERVNWFLEIFKELYNKYYKVYSIIGKHPSSLFPFYMSTNRSVEKLVKIIGIEKYNSLGFSYCSVAGYCLLNNNKNSTVVYVLPILFDLSQDEVYKKMDEIYRNGLKEGCNEEIEYWNGKITESKNKIDKVNEIIKQFGLE